jgi:hypothetical protein
MREYRYDHALYAATASVPLTALQARNYTPGQHGRIYYCGASHGEPWRIRFGCAEAAHPDGSVTWLCRPSPHD